MIQQTKKEMIGKKVKVNYNALIDEVARDEGVINNITDEFLILEINKKYKYISLNKIIRVEEL